MEINRRSFCQLLAAAGTASLLPTNGLSATESNQVAFASAAKSNDGSYWLAVTNNQGREIARHKLPGRGHHIAVHPTKPHVAAIARRPDTFLQIFDYDSGRLVADLQAGDDRHFYGHCVFSHDGQFLISTENQLSTGQGRVVVRDCHQHYRIVADFSSGGIGPHELVLTPDQQQVVVANGGIRTQGRKKLNLDTMRPNLSYLDLNTGTLLEQIEMPEQFHQLSIRHIDINSTGTVAIALQYQGALEDDVPLVALHRRGEQLQLLRAPQMINQQMKQYCGSARFDSSGEVVAISAPRGDLITFWEESSGQFIDHIRSRDGCGITATGNPAEFLVTTGTGKAYLMNPRSGLRNRQPLTLETPMSWDNHLSAVS